MSTFQRSATIQDVTPGSRILEFRFPVPGLRIWPLSVLLWARNRSPPFFIWCILQVTSCTHWTCSCSVVFSVLCVTGQIHCIFTDAADYTSYVVACASFATCVCNGKRSFLFLSLTQTNTLVHLACELCQTCLECTTVLGLNRSSVDTDRGRQLLLLCCWHAASTAWPLQTRWWYQIPIRLRQRTALSVQPKSVAAQPTIVKRCLQDSFYVAVSMWRGTLWRFNFRKHLVQFLFVLYLRMTIIYP